MLYRLKKLSKLASGKVLDIGFTGQYNLFLNGDVYRSDLYPIAKPPNYPRTIVWDATDLFHLPKPEPRFTSSSFNRYLILLLINRPTNSTKTEI